MNNYYSQWDDLDESEDSFLDEDEEIEQEENDEESYRETGCCSGCESCLL